MSSERLSGERRGKFAFVPGDELGIEIDVLAHRPTTDWVVGIALTNNVDLTVYGTNTKIMDVDLGQVTGRKTLRFGFKESRSSRGSTSSPSRCIPGWARNITGWTGLPHCAYTATPVRTV